MDPLTHSVLGMASAMAVCGTGKLRRAAGLTGLVAGLLPDADIFLRSDSDPLFALEYHRHFTHSLVFTPVIALLAVLMACGLYRVFGKAIPWKSLLLPGLAAAVSHFLCDVWTSYGTRVWWPFSDTRVAWDLIAVIDPLLTLPLLACVALALRYANRRAAVVGLLWVALYLGLCGVQKMRAESALRAWVAAEGLSRPERSATKPTLGNIIVWRGMLLHDGVFRAVAIRCGFSGVEVLPGETQEMFATPAAAARALDIPPESRQARDIGRFFHFSDAWVGLHPQEAATLGDLRYAALPQDIMPLWGIRVHPENPAGPVAWETFRVVNSTQLARFWKMISRGLDANGRGGDQP